MRTWKSRLSVEQRKAPRRSSWKWIGALLPLLFVFIAAWLLPLADWLRAFQGWVNGLGPAGMAVFVLLYIAVTVLLGPAWLLTLSAGFTYGLVKGVALVWVGATIGAAFAFLIARHLARPAVERLARRRAEFEAIDEAIGEKGWKIVALLRLSPLVPFTISNYLYGLTAIRFLPYVLATAAGMLPLTILYTYLGAVGEAAISGPRERTVWEWLAFAAGLAATIIGAIYITRIAKRELERSRLASGKPLKPSSSGATE